MSVFIFAALRELENTFFPTKSKYKFFDYYMIINFIITNHVTCITDVSDRVSVAGSVDERSSNKDPTDNRLK